MIIEEIINNKEYGHRILHLEGKKTPCCECEEKILAIM